MSEPKEEKKVVALYVRVSTDKQDITNQLLQLRPYCEKRGYLIYNEYVDVVSGGKDSRPAYVKMFQDAHQRKFDLVIFWALDRFSRSGTLFTLTKLKELENLGVAWQSYTEPYFDSAGQFKDVVLSIMATLAKIERERLSERTKAGMARKMATGWRPGRKQGVKDKKPRRKKGYYDNTNWAGDKKRGMETPREKPPINYVHEAKKKDAYLIEKRPLSSGPETEDKGEDDHGSKA